MTSIVDALLPHERRAVALVGLMIRMHGGKDGEGYEQASAKASEAGGWGIRGC